MQPPSPAVRAELERFLEADTSRLGEVFTRTRRGMSAEQIAADLDVSTSGFVSNYRTRINGLLEARIPRGGMPREVLQSVRRALRTSLSAETREYLSELEEQITGLALPSSRVTPSVDSPPVSPRATTSQAALPLPPAPGELRALLETFMATYSDARRGPFSGAHPVHQTLARMVEVFELSEPLLLHPEVAVRGSTGKGNWAAVPWVAFLDRRVTTTTREGVYPVILFREDMTGCYLTVAQGVTNLQQQGRAHMLQELELAAKRVTANDLADLNDRDFSFGRDLDLHSNSGLARDYTASTIVYKLYEADAVPDDVEILVDLDTALALVDADIETQLEARTEADPEPAAQELVPLAVIGEAFRRAVDTSGLRIPSAHGDRVRAVLAAIVAKPFVILSGMSGSGKTQLALRLGEWFGHGPYGPRALSVPVRPDWTGPEALFGYQDALRTPLDGRAAWFVPASLEFMLSASREPTTPYLLLLDEMNLAHIERYFSDFLSGMESRTPVLPNLVLGDDGEWRRDPGEPELIPLPRNLIVVGTVNVDETTYQFSPKVLDRATTFEVRTQTDELVADIARPVSVVSADPVLIESLVQWTVDDSWHRTVDTSDIAERMRSLHALLSESDDEFGHRVFYESQRMGAALRQLGVAGTDEVLDHIVLLKILPRIHGSRRRAEPVLQRLREFAAGAVDADNTGDAASALPLTAAKVARMLRAAEINQFVSFTD